MKALLMPIEMRNAIIQALGECRYKHVAAPISWLANLQTVDVPSPQDRERASSSHSEAESILAHKSQAMRANQGGDDE